MGLAAGLDRHRRPSRRGLHHHALALDAIIGGAGILRVGIRHDFQCQTGNQRQRTRELDVWHLPSLVR